MKNLITICLFFFASNLNAQILNPSFEEWDSVEVVGFDEEAPKNWHLGQIGEIYIQKELTI